MEFDELRATVNQLLSDFKSTLQRRAAQRRGRRGSGRAEGAPPAVAREQQPEAGTRTPETQEPKPHATQASAAPHKEAPSVPSGKEASSGGEEERKRGGEVGSEQWPPAAPRSPLAEEWEETETLDLEIDYSEDEVTPREAGEERKQPEVQPARVRPSPPQSKAPPSRSGRQQQQSARRLSQPSPRRSAREAQPSDMPPTPAIARKADETQTREQRKKKEKQVDRRQMPTCTVLDFVSFPTFYFLFLSLPSFTKSEVSLSLTPDRRLVVRAEREDEQREERETKEGGRRRVRLRVDRQMSTVEKCIKLPSDADDNPAGLKATFDKETLQILLPKLPARSRDKAEIPLA